MDTIDTKLNKYEHKIFSQNGEDGVILEIINRLYNNHNHNNKYFVEFGVQDGTECNTRLLRERYGWHGIMLDAENENKNINLYKEYITKENIINLFIKYNIPKHLNLLSIDIDYNDFYILYEIIKFYCLDIIILEYNASLVPFIDAVVKYDPYYKWDGTNYFGASLCAFTNLLNQYNYSLIYTESSGVNAFYVNNSLLKISNQFDNTNNIDALYNYPKYGHSIAGGHHSDHLYRRYLTSSSILTK